MRRILLLPLLALALACSDAAVVQPDGDGPAIARAGSPGGIAACPIEADIVVYDEPTFRTAVVTANAGDVIGIDGMIGLTGSWDVRIRADDVTLTCATPGSGLYMEPGNGLAYLLRVFARGVTVDRLVLDATGTLRGAYWAVYNGIGRFAEDVRFSNNTVTCTPSECAFFTGTARAIVVDNHFESPGGITGVHLQRLVNIAEEEFPIDGSVVQGNTVIAHGPPPPDPWDRGPVFGGIRVRDGLDVVVSDNVVEGPWWNSLSLQHLSASQVERNRLTGALSFGIGTSLFEPEGGYEDWDFVSEVVFRNNQVRDAGGPDAPYGISGGVVIYRACWNTLFGNNLQGNYDFGAYFEFSGANTLAGNQTVVIDNDYPDDYLDCDGDGAADPNIISGKGAVQNGVRLGELIREAASSTGGVEHQ